ncbi:MAG: hypothetical protein HKN73_04785, partial [Gemmatimonadetes bacterium]|nr:hypothetical protein [Gemmatimonadota bacterium]
MSADGRRILEAVEGVRAFLRRRLGAVAGLRVLAVTLVAMGLAPWLANASGWSPGSPLPLLLVAGLAAFTLASVWWWRRQSGRWGGETSVTRHMDKATNQLEGSVQGSLELARALPPGTSELLRGEAISRVGRQLGGDPARLAGDLGEQVGQRVRRGARILVAALPIVVLTALVAPERSLNAWRGLLRPVAVMAEARMPPVTVAPGTIQVSRGEVVDVEIEALLRDQVSLHWEMTGQVVQNRTVALVEGRGSGALPPVTAEVRYWAEAPDGGRSPVHTLTPVDPLFVSTFSVTVTYPPYTGLGSEEFRNEVPALLLPAGSHLRLQGQGSRVIGSGDIVSEAGEPVVTLDVTGDRFSAGWVPRRSGTYRWAFTD